MRSFVLGIDVGGTNVKIGLVNSAGRVFARTNLSTRSFVRSKNKLINAIVSSCEGILKEKKLKKKEILGIGIGLPGLVDTKRGVVHYLVNIPGWKNIPLKRIFEKRLRIPTFIDNDVNLMALGEWKFGAGRSIKNLICITLGTGVGGGLILNNELFRGDGFTAGEVGHIPLNEKGPRCNCGGSGCLESYVGNRYLLKKARKIFGKNITLEEITRRAKRKDKNAIRFWKEAGRRIGLGLTSVVNLLNPKYIIIGGGVANAHAYTFPAIREMIRTRAMKIPARMVRVTRAKLGVDAGIIGTQVLVKHALSSR